MAYLLRCWNCGGPIKGRGVCERCGAKNYRHKQRIVTGNVERLIQIKKMSENAAFDRSNC